MKSIQGTSSWYYRKTSVITTSDGMKEVDSTAIVLSGKTCWFIASDPFLRRFFHFLSQMNADSILCSLIDNINSLNHRGFRGNLFAHSQEPQDKLSSYFGTGKLVGLTALDARDDFPDGLATGTFARLA